MRHGGSEGGGSRGDREPLVVRGYRILLRLYPPALRRRHGREMVEVVRRRAAEGERARGRRSGATRRIGTLLSTWASAVGEAVAAWWERGLRSLGVRGVGVASRRPGGRRRGGSGDPRRREGRGARSARLPGGRLGDLGQEVEIAFRSLRRTPGFTAVAVLTLALGIGANTAIFSVVETVLLEPLPYPDSDRLVTMVGPPPLEYPWIYAEILLDLERSGESFEEVAGYYPRPFPVTGGDRPVEIEGARVTPDFFRTLGVGTARGRDFVEGDAQPGSAPAAIISHGLWQRRYGGSSDALGRSVEIDGRRHEIVGVLEPGFRQQTPRVDDPELWIPFELRPVGADGSLNWALPVLRIGDGVPMERAQAELDAVTAWFRQRHPDHDSARWHLRLVTLKSRVVGDVRTALLVLQLAVGLVLLLACVNVANLLLVRASLRRREMAVRSALGASRGRLVRQLMIESLVLGLLGGIAGSVLTVFGLELILAVAPEGVPRISEVSIDATVYLFALIVSIATGLLFGVIPALTGTRRSPGEALKESGRTTTGSVGRHRLSKSLVVAEVALTLILLVGAGLLVRSFVSLTGQEPGFRTEDVLTLSINVPESRFDGVPELEAHYRRIMDRLGEVPGVDSVAMANNLPIRRGGSTRDYRIEDASVREAATGRAGARAGGGTPAGGDAALPVAQYGVVSPGYFRTLEIPLLRGRTFTEGDVRGDPPVAIVDEAMWREAWPDRDPVGRRFSFQDEPDAWVTVVGVVGDIRGGGLGSAPRPGFYVPYQQRPDTEVELAVGRRVVILARPRSGMEPLDLAEPLRRALWEVDPVQPVAEIATLSSVVAEGAAPHRFRAVLLGGFAFLAVLLAVAGIYGVVEHLVAERTREFGIRVAMGATSGDIVRRVLRWGLGVSAVGIAVGLVGVFAVSRFLASLLFGVTPTDPATLVGAVAIVVLVALTACLSPARRAVGIDPVAALRSEGRPTEGPAG